MLNHHVADEICRLVEITQARLEGDTHRGLGEEAHAFTRPLESLERLLDRRRLGDAIDEGLWREAEQAVLELRRLAERLPQALDPLLGNNQYDRLRALATDVRVGAI